jgi:hypothetical protein
MSRRKLLIRSPSNQGLHKVYVVKADADTLARSESGTACCTNPGGDAAGD